MKRELTAARTLRSMISEEQVLDEVLVPFLEMDSELITELYNAGVLSQGGGSGGTTPSLSGLWYLSDTTQPGIQMYENTSIGDTENIRNNRTMKKRRGGRNAMEHQMKKLEKKKKRRG